MVNCDRTTVKHAFQNTQNNCYQWLSNSSRVHQIRFGPRWGSLHRSPDPLAGLMEPTSKGRGRKETGKEGRRGRGRGGRDREQGNGMEGVGMPGKKEGRGGEEERRGGERRGNKKSKNTFLSQFLPTPLNLLLLYASAYLFKQ